MELLGVRVELPANTPVVMLREVGPDRPRVLPILIGGPEASAIHSALEGIVPPRPLTHDLLVVVIEALGASLTRVVITEVREHTFYAELHLTTTAGIRTLSCRPSDAIALAVRTETPIFAEDSLLDEAAVEASIEAGDVTEEAILDEFRDFLDDISPDDFAG
ncbi:MAG TPA: bifunctional nuclease family protein [Ilumatobacteraceae bacterium]|nr:bifunctional nuclease family protein [Ilumatobacteraceae bacterium]HRB04417.1 bifunctional nuclease family protein [Ilumatobacteraceae bacterium]